MISKVEFMLCVGMYVFVNIFFNYVSELKGYVFFIYKGLF